MLNHEIEDGGLCAKMCEYIQLVVREFPLPFFLLLSRLYQYGFQIGEKERERLGSMVEREKERERNRYLLQGNFKL